MSSNASSRDNNIFASTGIKRTRSQVPNLTFDVTLQRSPLKDARLAIRNGNKSLESNSEDSELKREGSVKHDNIRNNHSNVSTKKRTSSPSMDQVEVKRPKLVQQNSLPALFARQIAKKPNKTYVSRQPDGQNSSISSINSIEPVVTTPPLLQVMETCKNPGASPLKEHNIPFIDLTTVSPFRRNIRSASPGKLKLRIVSEGDVIKSDSGCKKSHLLTSPTSARSIKEAFAPEATLPSLAVPEGHTVQQSSLDGDNANASNVVRSSETVLSSENRPMEQSFEKKILQHDPPECFDFSSASDAKSKIHTFDTPSLPVSVGEKKASVPPVSLPPLSPLTPLSPTPSPPNRSLDNKSLPKLGYLVLPDSEAEKRSDHSANTPGPSRLPRLSVAFPPIQDVTANAHSAANVPSSSVQRFDKSITKYKSYGGKSMKKRAEVNSFTARRQSQIRMTRSATLRQMQIQKQIKKRSSSVQPLSSHLSGSVKLFEEERGSRNTRMISRSKPRRSTSCPPDSPVASSVHRKFSNNKSIQNPDDQLPPNKRHKRFVLTVPSSLSPVKASKQRENQDYNALSSPGKSILPPPITDVATRIRSQTTLGNLSTALEKLAQPVPTRPNTRHDKDDEDMQQIRPSTTMGFNRVIPDVFSPPEASHHKGVAPIVIPSSSLEETPMQNSNAEKEKGIKKYFPTSASERTMKTQKKISPPTRSTSSGNMVSGRRPIFGVGGNPFSKSLEKASRKTPLSTVVGSPAKPERDQDSVEDQSMETTHPDDNTEYFDSESNEKDFNVSQSSIGDYVVLLQENKTSKDNNISLASRRASMAFSSLTQSIPAFTSPKEESSSNRPIKEQRSVSAGHLTRALRSNTSFALSANGFETPVLKESTPVMPSTTAAEVGREGTNIPPGAYVKKSHRSKMPGSLDVLKGCTIFVDVKTEDGEDAGSLFVDMLRGLGAKILARVGQSCTHLIYKNGLQSTLTRYRLLEDPRPHVVGIGWVVECAEKREKVDELKFKIELDNMNISGSPKRRKSLHKQMFLLDDHGSHTDEEPENSVRPESSFDENTNSVGDSGKSVILDNLPPLEKARRRSLMFPQS